MSIVPKRRHPALPAILAAALSLALYAVNLHGTLIYDDVQIIGADLRVQSPRLWSQLWTRDYFNGGVDNLYRPLVLQTYAIQYWLHGTTAWPYHLVNILCNAAACAAVAELARRLVNWRVGIIAGLLFAVHPVHVEAVAEIVGRADEMCLLFMALALILLLHRPLTTPRAALIGLSGILAMLCKEQGMLLPFLLLALILCTHWRPVSPAEKQAGLLLVLISCWSVAGLILLREQVLKLRFEWDPSFLDDAIQPLIYSTRLQHAQMVIVILGRYAQLLAVPWRLSIDYGLSVMGSAPNYHEPYLYFGIASLFCVGIAFVAAIVRRNHAALFCLISAALVYGMVSNIILIGTIFGERLLYLPSAFLLTWAAIHLDKLSSRVLVPLMAVILVLGSWRTTTYAARWNDRARFYEISLREQPESVKLYELVIVQHMESGDLAGAHAIADKGERAAPTYWNIWFLDGVIAERQQRWADAYARFSHAMELRANVPLAAAVQRARNEMHSGHAEKE